MARMINDHGFWAGSKPADGVCPSGSKSKVYSPAEGAGALSDYQDTSEKIKSLQESNKSSVRANAMSPAKRN